MWLSNTWHLVKLWRMKSYCLARSKWDLGVTSGCAGWQCQQCSPWPCQHVADSTGLRSGSVLLCKAESIDVSDCTQTFPLWLPTSIQWSIQSLREGFVCCAKSPSLFSGVHRAGRRGGVNICNPVQRRQCLATPCLGLPLGQADWGISRLRQRLLTET